MGGGGGGGKGGVGRGENHKEGISCEKKGEVTQHEDKQRDCCNRAMGGNNAHLGICGVVAINETRLIQHSHNVKHIQHKQEGQNLEHHVQTETAHTRCLYIYTASYDD